MGEQRLPHWESVAVVIAHPDDESFGLGAVIDSFVRAGARVRVVCLTQGEASTLAPSDGLLSAVRAAELEDAAEALGVERADLLGFPDGRLADIPVEELLGEVIATLEPAQGLLAFDPSGVTGHPDHVRATEVAVDIARGWGCGLLGWTIPRDVAEALRRETQAGFVGHAAGEIDITLRVERDVQRRAIEAHRSQAVPGSALWRRLELFGEREHLRWIVGPDGRPPAGPM